MRLAALLCFGIGLSVPASTVAQAQEIEGPEASRAQLVIPQARGWSWSRQTRAVEITQVDARVSVNEQVATTSMTVHLKNPTSRQLEARVLIPVPNEVVVRGFDFQGSASEPTAELLPREKARTIYNQIVSKLRDPALLEFAGYNMIRSSVFPVPANGTQAVRVTYEQLLPADGSRVDYVLPRSQSVTNKVPWNIRLQVNSKRAVSTVYSPSHQIETDRTAPGTVNIKVSALASHEPGDFRLSYLMDDGNVSASLLAYPDPGIKGGYFVLLTGLPAQPPAKNAIKREVTIVLDRSGSMNGKKIKQAREAIRQVIAGLEHGEAFNIIAYNEALDSFAEKPVLKSDKTEQEASDFIDSIRPRGGTNIHDALLESLRQKPADDMLPLVLFFTDGLPTIGQTSEKTIRDVATNANQFKRRVFTFGVGVDVNTPLLEGIADRTRAKSTFVLPDEDVELKVAQVFKRLSGPVLADTTLKVLNEDNTPAKSRVHDLLPTQLPDMFREDQLVLVGQYRGSKPLVFELGGNYLGEKKSFRFDFKLDKASTRNVFVPRLWASRKIGVLIDAIRQLGAADRPLADTTAVVDDPRTKELVEEIVRLSTEFGILTEYTAFLAREGTNLSDFKMLSLICSDGLKKRAVATRSGISSYNQTLNLAQQKRKGWVNNSNRFFDGNLKQVEITNVQPVNSKCYFARGQDWIASDLAKQNQKEIKADREVEFGSKEFFRLVASFEKQNRQGELALYGNILLKVGGKTVRVKNPQKIW